MKRSVLFFVVLIIHILAALLSLESLEIGSKVLLMPILFWTVFARRKSYPHVIPLFLGLLFSWFGDVLLIYDGQLFFILGLGSFLIAHLAYIFIFTKRMGLKVLRLWPFLGFAGLFCFGVLKNVLPPDLALPVYVYMGMISLMAFIASCRKVGGASYEYVLIGAVLFIISDAFIAVNQFLVPVPFVVIWVMSTYGLAQFLVVNGLLKEDLKVS
ncbi:MAG: putative membrane protein YhhN [Arcticibacterium sp.]|jgi:uncharacterized membrane protein YhhN